MNAEPEERLPQQQGMYLLTLYGRAGSKLYQCYVPVTHDLSYTLPAMHNGMEVHGVTLEWQEP